MDAHELLAVFSGYRHHQRYRWVVDVNGVRKMNSQLAEFDWGPACSIAWRRPLAAGLLFWSGFHTATPDCVDAFAEEVVTQFEDWGFSITPDQVRDWVSGYCERKARKHGP